MRTQYQNYKKISSVTYRMGSQSSHSVTCRLTQVNASSRNYSQTGPILDSPTQEGWEAEFTSWVVQLLAIGFFRVVSQIIGNCYQYH